MARYQLTATQGEFVKIVALSDDKDALARFMAQEQTSGTSMVLDIVDTAPEAVSKAKSPKNTVAESNEPL